MKVYEKYDLRSAENPLLDRIEVDTLGKYLTAELDFNLRSVPAKVLSGVLNRGAGVEIECEDILESQMLSDNWVYHKDGSLRGNSREYVTSYGVRVGHLLEKLMLFESEVLKGRKRYGLKHFTFGERTSIHVHIDVRQFTDDQVRSLLILYTLFEDTLFDFSGPSRKSNVFATPFRDSTLLRGKWTSVWDAIQTCEKYCAFNINAVQNLGTVEFRHMEGTENAERIFSWVMMLSLLVRFAQRVPLEEVQKEVEAIKVESQYDIFLRRVFFGFANKLHWNANNLDESASDAKLFFKD